MRIVIANNYLELRGGSERVMQDEAAWLQKQGHEVILFGRLPPDSLPDLPLRELMPPLPDYEQSKGFERVRLAAEVIYNQKTGLQFREFLQRVRPDIVHGHNIYAGLTTAILDECTRARIPSVLTLHDYKLVCPSYRLLRGGKPCTLCVSGGAFYHCATTRCHKSSLQASLISTTEAYFNSLSGRYLQANRLLCPSSFMKQMLLDGGFPQSKLALLPNGIHIGPPPHPEPQSEAYALYLGRLSEEKGLLTLLRAFENVPLPLRVVGDGPIRPELEAFARDRGLANISFEGSRTGTELTRLLRGAAFVVVPSEWYENASMVVLEAMEAGIPVIASRIGGLPEQVVDGVTGLLVEPGDPVGLQSAILKLAQSPHLRWQMAKAARMRAEQSFSMEKHGNELLKIYEHAMHDGHL